MDKSEILGTLRGGLGLAGKLAGKGIGEVSGLFKGRDEPGGMGDSGLYWQRRPHPAPGGLLPAVEVFEPQEVAKFGATVMKNLTVSRAERAFMQACADLVTGRLDSASEKLRDAVARDAQMTDGYFVLGCVHLEAAQPQEAVRNFQKALLCQQGLGTKVRKYLPSFRMALGLSATSTFAFCADLLGLNVLLSIAQRAAGRADDAILTLEQLLGVMPAEPVALFFMALYHLEAGQFRRVVDDLKDFLPDTNVHVADLVLLGKACEGLGDPVTARDLYRKALARQDLDPTLKLDLRFALGEALAAEGWPGDAEQEFRAVRDEAPHFVPLLERLGVAPARSPSPPRALPPSAPPAALPESTEPPAPRATREVTPEEVPESEPEPEAPAPPATPSPLPPARPGETRLVSDDSTIDLALSRQAILIGREEGDIVLNHDSAASRAHARITYEDGAYWIEDLNSTNGTWVNRHRLSRRVELHRGDVVQIGQTTFRIL